MKMYENELLNNIPILDFFSGYEIMSPYGELNYINGYRFLYLDGRPNTDYVIWPSHILKIIDSIQLIENLNVLVAHIKIFLKKLEI